MKKTYLKIIAIIACVIMLLGLNVIGFYYFVSNELDLKDVLVASHDILPRTLITQDDIKHILVPGAYLKDGVYEKEEEIEGKYTDIQGKIPSGSLFYQGMLYNASELPDYPSSCLKEGQVSYSLKVDMNKLAGNTIVPSQRIDIYVSIIERNKVPLVDSLIINARILSIKDAKGLDLSDQNSTGIPSIMLIAVDESMVEYLTIAEKVGDIEIHASSSTYDTSLEASLNTKSKVLPYLYMPN